MKNLMSQTSMKQIIVLSMLAVLPMAACKQKEAKKSNPPAVTTPTDPNNTNPVIAIEVVGQTGTNFQFARGETVQLRFRITGTATQTNLLAALSVMPTGGQLSGPNTAEPIFTWSALNDGTYNLTLLVRDMALCAQSGAVDCQINPAQYGSIIPNSNYDVTQSYTITVGNNSTLPGNGQVGNNITSGGASNSGFLSNALGGIGNVFGGIGSFVSNMGSSIWDFITGLFS